MQKKYTSTYLLFALGFVLFLFTGSSDNPPNGRTGAPGDGLCSDCHTGNNPNGYDGSISLTGLPATIQPNTSYTITVTSSNPNGLADRTGFQWVALNSSNSNAGTMSSASVSSTITSEGGRSYHEHDPALDFGAETEVSWTVTWTSPAAGANEETITFYGASVIASGGNGNDDDLVVSTQASGTLPAALVDPLVVTVEKISDVSCNGENDGVAIANVSGGVGPYSFLWDNGNTNQTADDLAPGDHTVTVTDAQPASNSGSVTIDEPPVLELSIIEQINIDCDNPLGSATVEGSGGSPDYTYSWSTGATGPTATDLPAGSNEVTITDANGCTETSTLFISSNSIPPVVNAGPNQSIDCINNTAELTGSVENCTNCIFLWSTSDGDIASSPSLATVTVNAAGTYTFTATNSDNGCTDSDNVIVALDTNLPEVDAGLQDTLNCVISSLMLSATVTDCSNCSVNWTTPDGNITAGQNTTTPTIDTTGTYIIEATNLDNGCVVSDMVQIVEDLNVPIADAGEDGILNCSITEVSLEGQAGSCPDCTFAWSTADGNISNGQNEATATANLSGTYVLTVTDQSSGCTDTDTVLVIATTSVVLNVESTIPPDCNGDNNGSATVVASAGSSPYAFSWPTGGDLATEIGLAAGSYIVTVMDSDGCEDEVQVIIEDPDELVVNATSTGETGADSMDGTASAEPEGGTPPYTYEWSNGETTAQITDLAPGFYSILVRDANGCGNGASVTVNSFECAIGATVDLSQVSCSGGNDGQATLVLENAAEPLSITWNTGGTGLTETGLAAGNYSVTVNDANACPATVSFTITDPSLLISSLDSVLAVDCHSTSTGAVLASATGGTAPYTYAWSNGSSDQNLEGVPAGEYMLVTTDSSFCTDTLLVEVTEPDPLGAMLSFTDESAFETNNGTAEATTSGGTPPYTYLWSNGDTSNPADNLAPGSYSLTITDANECTYTDSVTIAAFICNPLTIVSSMTDTICPLNNEGLIVIDSVIGANLPLEYEWSNGNSDPELENIGGGSYSVTVIDQTNCSISADFEIVEFDEEAPMVTFCPENITSTECNPIIDYALPMGVDNCGTVGLNLLEGLESGSIFPTGNTNVVYGLADPSGNVATCSFQVTVIPEFMVEVEPVAVSCYGELDGQVIISPTGGMPPYSIAGPTENLPPGIYTVTVTDAAGCSITDNFMIIEPAPLTINVDQIIPATEGNADGIALISVSGGTGVRTFTWLDASGTVVGTEENLQNVEAGVYTVMVTDENGCTTETIVTISIMSAVNDPGFLRQIQLAPNPSSGELRLFIEFDRPRKVQLFMHDIYGKEIWQSQRQTQASYTWEMNLRDQSPGIYLLRIRVENEIIVRRVILQ